MFTQQVTFLPNIYRYFCRRPFRLPFFARRVFGVGLLTFFLSMAFSTFFRLTRAVVPFWFSTGILLIVVLLGIVFDIVGTAVTAAQEAPFHAMASDRVTGARTAMAMVRNADRVASFCNDVVGDICGTVSGAIGSALVIDLVIHYQVFRYEDLISIIMVGLVAAVTVGGKAWGKAFAIQRANFIILQVGKIGRAHV